MKEIFVSLPRGACGFEIEALLTCATINKEVPIAEVPITYTPRSIGKKIRFRDGFIGMWTIIKNRLQQP